MGSRTYLHRRHARELHFEEAHELPGAVAVEMDPRQGTDDGSVRFTNLMMIPNASNGTIFAAHTTQVMSPSIKIISADGTPYYVMCTATATNRS